VTGNDFVATALKRLGVLAAGETANANDAQDVLSRLNDLVDSWSLDRLWLFTTVRTTKTLTSGTASYTIGAGGAINIARPTWIDRAGLIIDTSASTPTEVRIELLTNQRWQGIQQKTLQSGLSTAVFYDHAWSAGLGNVYPWPIPSVSTTQLVLYTPGVAVSAFADLTTDYTFAPGYRRALWSNLAVEIAPEFGKAVDGATAAIASESRAAVKRANIETPELVVDEALTRGDGGLWNWRTGDFRR
jgi:hypothetical protein